MQVPDNKDIANRVVPESCVSHREVRREALTGVRIGQQLSRDRKLIPDADVVSAAEGNMFAHAIASEIERVTKVVENAGLKPE